MAPSKPATPTAASRNPTADSDVVLRALTEGDVDRWFRQAVETFGRRPTNEEIERVSGAFDVDRAVAAWDDATLVGTAVAFDMQLTVPGGARLPCAGVSMVTVAPTHRRRGLLRRMLHQLFEEAADRGDALAALYASEGGIYRRFGYGPAAPSVKLTIPADAAGMAGDPLPARDMRLLTREQAATVLPALHDRVVALTPGSVGVPGFFWRRWNLPDTGNHPRRVAVLGEPGAERGYVIYKAAPDWREGAPAAADGTLTVEYLAGVDATAQLELWRYVLGVDLMRRSIARLRPRDDLVLLALRDPLAVEVQADEPLWLRFVDLPAALAARRYASDGTVVFELTDPSEPRNAGSWALEVVDGVGQALRTEATPDLQLDIADLATVYLGSTALRDLCRAGRVRELTDGSAERVDDMLRTWPTAWNGTHF